MSKLQAYPDREVLILLYDVYFVIKNNIILFFTIADMGPLIATVGLYWIRMLKNVLGKPAVPKYNRVSQT